MLCWQAADSALVRSSLVIRTVRTFTSAFVYSSVWYLQRG